jgi:hypothetical protein
MAVSKVQGYVVHRHVNKCRYELLSRITGKQSSYLLYMGRVMLTTNNLLFNTYYMADRMYMQYSPSVNEVHPEQQLYVHCSVYMRSKVKTIPIVHVDPERLCP